MNRISLLKILRLSLLVFVALPGYSQFESNYIPVPIQDTIPEEVKGRIASKLAADLSTIPDEKPKVKQFIRDLYQRRSDSMEQLFNDDYFIVDSLVTPWLASILDKIYDANPQINRAASVYAFRSDVPNAMSYGDGTIAFTLGLLARLQSEDQVAFVICHELAHYFREHSNNQVLEYARLNYNKDLNKEVKSILKSDYEKNTRLSKLAYGLGQSMAHHSREKELEADSIALGLYLNTSYAITAPIQTLEILDHADESLYQNPIDLKKYFDVSPLYPFKESWLAYSNSSFQYDDEADSLRIRTHPECTDRISAIQQHLKSSGYEIPSHPLGVKENPFRTSSEFESIESLYHFNEYGKALFYSLALAERFPKNAYLHARIMGCLYQLYSYQKMHELSKVMNMPGPRLPENYNRVVTFIHTLRLMELASLTYYYGVTHKSQFFTDDEFVFAFWFASHLEVSKDSPDSIAHYYISTFPKGRYQSKIKFEY